MGTKFTLRVLASLEEAKENKAQSDVLSLESGICFSVDINEQATCVSRKGAQWEQSSHCACLRVWRKQKKTKRKVTYRHL